MWFCMKYDDGYSRWKGWILINLGLLVENKIFFDNQIAKTIRHEKEELKVLEIGYKCSFLAARKRSGV